MSSKRFGHAGQDFVAGAGDQHVVFDANAAPTGEVNTRLDRHDHPRPKHGLVLYGQPRSLVNLQSRFRAPVRGEIGGQNRPWR